MWAWLAISFVQTFVVIPLLVHRWGKGAYCGWICSCGGMAETMGDAHRHKMPHGPAWNQLNMLGQGFLAIAMLLLLTRAVAWTRPGSVFGRVYSAILHDIPVFNYVLVRRPALGGNHRVRAVLALFGPRVVPFCLSAGRPHAHLRPFQHLQNFLGEKRCISCNVCTSVCHQGIDIMNFADKGLPLEDPECVRCSACVQSCPTGVLAFGRIDRRTGTMIGLDRLAASPVRMAEVTVNGRRLAAGAA